MSSDDALGELVGALETAEDELKYYTSQAGPGCVQFVPDPPVPGQVDTLVDAAAAFGGPDVVAEEEDDDDNDGAETKEQPVLNLGLAGPRGRFGYAQPLQMLQQQQHGGNPSGGGAREFKGSPMSLDGGDDGQMDIHDDQGQQQQQLELLGCLQRHNFPPGQPRPIETAVCYEDLNSHPAALRALQELRAKWMTRNGREATAHARHIFGCTEAAGSDAIDHCYKALFKEIGLVHAVFVRRGLILDGTNPGKGESAVSLDYMRQFNELFDLVYSSRLLLQFAAHVEMTLDPLRRSSVSSKLDLFRFKEVAYAKLNGVQNMVLYCLRLCGIYRLRRLKGTLYREIRTPENLGTYAYEPYCTIEDFVHNATDKNTRFDQWVNSTDRSLNFRDTVKYLERCRDMELPELVTERTVTSWRDGVYFANSDPHPIFMFYKDRRLPADLTSCKYFPHYFDHTQLQPDNSDFMRITDTPVHRILEHQGYKDAHERGFVFAMLGRLIFQPGHRDFWEVIPMLYGQAGTGKSSIVSACERFFEERDVVALGNNIETTFGLQAVRGKKLFVMPDIKGDCRLDNGDLQTMTSLETMQINVKYEEACTYRWDVAGLLAGNALPRGWRDKFDSVARRLMLIEFPNRVKSTARDNTLKQRILETFGSFYRLCVLAYRHWTRLYGKTDIWPHAPDRIKAGKNIVRQQGNSMAQFLDSDRVKMGSEARYVRQEAFLDAYRAFCRNWNQKPAAMHAKELQQELRAYGACRFIEAVKEWPLDQPQTPARSSFGQYITGIELLPHAVRNPDEPQLEAGMGTDDAGFGGHDENDDGHGASRGHRNPVADQYADQQTGRMRG